MSVLAMEKKGVDSYDNIKSLGDFKMLNTQKIIAKFKSAVTQYDLICNNGKMFSAPGKAGIRRRDKFVTLLNSLKLESPKETIEAIYAFYKEHGNGRLLSRQDSRLIDNIQRCLCSIANIKEEDFSYSTVYEGARKLNEEERKQQSKLDAFIKTFDSNSDNDFEKNSENNPKYAIGFHNSL